MYRIDPAFVRGFAVGFVFVVDGNRAGAKALNVIKTCTEARQTSGGGYGYFGDGRRWLHWLARF